ncbi:hypothetical protein FIBSPDRAFT_926519, partial [Athelia psychrophila]
TRKTCWICIYLGRWTLVYSGFPSPRLLISLSVSVLSAHTQACQLILIGPAPSLIRPLTSFDSVNFRSPPRHSLQNHFQPFFRDELLSPRYRSHDHVPANPRRERVLRAGRTPDARRLLAPPRAQRLPRTRRPARPQGQHQESRRARRHARLQNPAPGPGHHAQPGRRQTRHPHPAVPHAPAVRPPHRCQRECHRAGGRERTWEDAERARVLPLRKRLGGARCAALEDQGASGTFALTRAELFIFPELRLECPCYPRRPPAQARQEAQDGCS